MLIAGVVCVCAAGVLAALGLWSLARPDTNRATNGAELVMRAVAPPQLAAAVMLAAGSWQIARYSLRHGEAPAPCGSVCAACTLACH